MKQIITLGVPDRPLFEATPASKSPSLDELQDYVGGYIEAVSVDWNGSPAIMYVNENGHYDKLPLNVPASLIFWSRYRDRIGDARLAPGTTFNPDKGGGGDYIGKLHEAGVNVMPLSPARLRLLNPILGPAVLLAGFDPADL